MVGFIFLIFEWKQQITTNKQQGQYSPEGPGLYLPIPVRHVAWRAPFPSLFVLWGREKFCLKGPHQQLLLEMKQETEERGSHSYCFIYFCFERIFTSFMTI